MLKHELSQAIREESRYRTHTFTDAIFQPNLTVRPYQGSTTEGTRGEAIPGELRRRRLPLPPLLAASALGHVQRIPFHPSSAKPPTIPGAPKDSRATWDR